MSYLKNALKLAPGWEQGHYIYEKLCEENVEGSKSTRTTEKASDYSNKRRKLHNFLEYHQNNWTLDIVQFHLEIPSWLAFGQLLKYIYKMHLDENNLDTNLNTHILPFAYKPLRIILDGRLPTVTSGTPELKDEGSRTSIVDRLNLTKSVSMADVPEKNTSVGGMDYHTHDKNLVAKHRETAGNGEMEDGDRILR